MNDEILVPLDLSDAIAMIDRQKQEIAALTAENERPKQALEELVKEALQGEKWKVENRQAGHRQKGR